MRLLKSRVMNSVLILYPYFPLYRLGVLSEINRINEIDLTLASDLNTLNGVRGIPIDTLEKFNWFELRNIWLLRNKFLWQKGLFNRFWNNDFSTIIILANPYHLSTWVFSIYQRFLGKRVLFWTHGIIKQETGLKLFIRKTFLSIANDLLLYSVYSKDQLLKHGFSSSRLHVIYNSVYNDYSGFTQINWNYRKLEKETSKFHIVFIGRLTPQKKLLLLMQAFDQLIKQEIECTLSIVGVGPELEKIKNFVVENNLIDSVIFHGAVYDEELVGDILMNCDLCISPGEVGLTSIHCMQYGVPVITHGNKENQMPEFEIIEAGISGDFFEEDNLSSLIEVTKNWILTMKDKRQEVYQNCIKQVLHIYNPKFQSELIRQVINNRLSI